ncbi:MAG: hypothetical protein RSC90_04060 [Clostridia bacterium]
MKKLACAILCVALLLGGAVALAEEPEIGKWVQFEDGFEIMVPEDWADLAITDEMAEMIGCFYRAGCADATQEMRIGWMDMDAQSQEELWLAVEGECPKAFEISLGDVTYLALENAKGETAALAVLDEGCPGGVYLYQFFPRTAGGITPEAQEILLSMQDIPPTGTVADAGTDADEGMTLGEIHVHAAQ